MFVTICATFANLPLVDADDAGKDKAQALFKEGRAAIEHGNKATGCAKMRESLQIFAVANTLFNVAQCDEGEGKIASALEHWERGNALIDEKDPRKAVASERITALDARVPRLRIVVPEGLSLLSIVLDDKPMVIESLRNPLRLEPGRHLVVVQAKDRKDRIHEIVLAERERTEFVATPSAETVKLPDPSPVGHRPDKHSNSQKTVGFVVAGVGAAGVIAAGITGSLVASRDSDIQACFASPANDAPCFKNIREDVAGYKNLLTGNAIAWGVGAAGLGAGLFLILTAQPPKESAKPAITMAPLVVPGGAAIGLSGRF